MVATKVKTIVGEVAFERLSAAEEGYCHRGPRLFLVAFLNRVPIFLLCNFLQFTA